MDYSSDDSVIRLRCASFEGRELLQTTGRVPLHLGKAVQPQNSLPAFVPWRAIRATIGAPHDGHAGVRELLASPDVSLGTERDDRSVWIAKTSESFANSSPSTSSTFLPAAKLFASFVKWPLVTTKPPAAPVAAITPYNSRTICTPTL